MDEIVEILRKESSKARRAAWASVLLIVLSVAFLVTFFFLNQLNADEDVRMELTKVVKETQDRLKDVDMQIERAVASPGRYQAEISPSVVTPQKNGSRTEADEVRAIKMELEQNRAAMSQHTGTLAAITSAAVRIGAVVIGMYLVGILLSLTRYHFRLADHLYLSSVAIKAFPNNLDGLEKLSQILSIRHIDFGKAPPLPIEHIVEAAKMLAAKR